MKLLTWYWGRGGLEILYQYLTTIHRGQTVTQTRLLMYLHFRQQFLFLDVSWPCIIVFISTCIMKHYNLQLTLQHCVFDYTESSFNGKVPIFPLINLFLWTSIVSVFVSNVKFYLLKHNIEYIPLECLNSLQAMVIFIDIDSSWKGFDFIGSQSLL